MQAPPNLALADGPALPPPVLGANVPPPGDGEDRGAAASDAARFYSTPLSLETQEEMEAEPAPPPTAGSTTGGVFQRRHWKQDSLASEDRLMVRMDQMQTNMHQAVESFNAVLREGTGRGSSEVSRGCGGTSWRPTSLAVVAVLSQPIY